MKKIITFIGLAVSVTVLLTFTYHCWAFLDGRWAHAEDVRALQKSVEKTNQRITQKIDQDQLDFYNREIMKIKTQYPAERDMPMVVRDSYRFYMIERGKLQDKMGVKK